MLSCHLLGGLGHGIAVALIPSTYRQRAAQAVFVNARLRYRSVRRAATSRSKALFSASASDSCWVCCLLKACERMSSSCSLSQQSSSHCTCSTH